MTRIIKKGDVNLLKRTSNEYYSKCAREFQNCENIEISGDDTIISFEYKYTTDDGMIHKRKITSNCEFMVWEDIGNYLEGLNTDGKHI